LICTSSAASKLGGWLLAEKDIKKLI